MKFPHIEVMESSYLIRLAEQKGDAEFTKSVERLVMSRALNVRPDWKELLVQFGTTSGLKRKITGQMMALELIDNYHFIEMGVLDELLGEIDDEYLWPLAKVAKNEHIRDYAFDEIMRRLEVLEEKLREDFDFKANESDEVMVFKPQGKGKR